MEIIREYVKQRGIFRLEIFEGEKTREPWLKPIDVIEFPNLLTNTGGALVEDLLMGAGGTAFNNANSNIGSGDSATAVNATHTDLQAASNKLRKGMVATFPSRAGQIITFQSSFTTSEANWQWNEMGVFNANAAGTMLCRALVSNPFTKTSALSITATYTWTVA